MSAIADALTEHYTACDLCRFDEPCAIWSALLGAHYRATTTKARYLVAWHDARSAVRRAAIDGDTYTSDGVPVHRLLANLVDRFEHHDPSVVGPAVDQYRSLRYVGPAWRNMARRDIPGRYPRLNIP
jgi:hypothetical protein